MPCPIRKRVVDLQVQTAELDPVLPADPAVVRTALQGRCRDRGAPPSGRGSGPVRRREADRHPDNTTASPSPRPPRGMHAGTGRGCSVSPSSRRQTARMVQARIRPGTDRQRARRPPSTVVSCQHGSAGTPEEGDGTCVARGRKRRVDRGADTVRSPLGRHAMRGGWRYLRMPGVRLVHASKSRQPCQAVEALHRTVSSSEMLTIMSTVTCPTFTSP